MPLQNDKKLSLREFSNKFLRLGFTAEIDVSTKCLPPAIERINFYRVTQCKGDVFTILLQYFLQKICAEYNKYKAKKVKAF